MIQVYLGLLEGLVQRVVMSSYDDSPLKNINVYKCSLRNGKDDTNIAIPLLEVTS